MDQAQGTAALHVSNSEALRRIVEAAGLFGWRDPAELGPGAQAALRWLSANVDESLLAGLEDLFVEAREAGAETAESALRMALAVIRAGLGDDLEEQDGDARPELARKR